MALVRDMSILKLTWIVGYNQGTRIPYLTWLNIAAVGKFNISHNKAVNKDLFLRLLSTHFFSPHLLIFHCLITLLWSFRRLRKKLSKMYNFP